MILIADGGSTKCDWILLDPNGDVVLKTRTRGLNPAVISPEEIRNRMPRIKIYTVFLLPLQYLIFMVQVVELKPLLNFLLKF